MNRDNSLSIVTQALRDIATNAVPGSKLPSVRELTKKYRISPATVERAFARLSAEGLIEPRPGQGTFVRGRADPIRQADFSWQSVALGPARVDNTFLATSLAVASSGSISLSMGYLPPDLQATALLAGALRRAAVQPELWDRLPFEGFEPLRAWFAQEVADGGVFTPHDVIVCPGGQAAISSTVRALVPRGAPMLVEAPTYSGAIAAARAAGAELVPVGMDENGVRPDLLADAFRQSRARVFYCQPTFANPSGATLSVERRAAVLAIAADARAFVIEDDWARDLGLDGPPPPPLAAGDRHGHVVYIRSLSKAAAPGLRVAAIMARGAALARIRTARSSDDLSVCGPLQAAALSMLSTPAWRRHVNAVRSALIERRDALVVALKAETAGMVSFRLPQGGMHLWAELPDHIPDLGLAAELARRGVLASPGQSWFASEPAGSFLRLTYGATPALLREGVARIAATLKEWPGNGETTRYW
ncbi:PLP-dependent aminotransferase family protein [Rhizobium sp. 2YAF20]|uniref:aminotransferase-like domain-containing protein n=1 Tax=Rhizobium sp. 2YAF20 TaxID=3233027 RepID=UPI003F9AA3AD